MHTLSGYGLLRLTRTFVLSMAFGAGLPCVLHAQRLTRLGNLDGVYSEASQTTARQSVI